MKILLVDDEDISRDAVRDFLHEQLGYDVIEATDGYQAWELFQAQPVPLIISDIRMPKMTGIELLRKIKESTTALYTEMILFTGYADIQTAIEALRLGAYDYLYKPVNIEELAILIERVEEKYQLRQENSELKNNFNHVLEKATHEINYKLKNLQNTLASVQGIGNIGIFSDAMQGIMTIANKLHADRSVPVLIEGDTGTGKEIVARKVHFGDENDTSPFITINCAAISPSLFESELYGYEEGSFTGAKKQGNIGKFELAQGGTLFLDEIGEIPLEMQPKLLRALQQKEIYRVGGTKKIKLDVRIIGATNKNLLDQVKLGLFRADLYYRLNVARISIPNLKDRKEEIIPLAQLFLTQLSDQKKKNFRMIQKEAASILENYPWPGNIRELQNTIERVVLLYDDLQLKADHLRFLQGEIDFPLADQFLLQSGTFSLPKESLDLEALELEIVRKALAMFDGNRTKTADYLKITRSALRSRLSKL